MKCLMTSVLILILLEVNFYLWFLEETKFTSSSLNLFNLFNFLELFVFQIVRRRVPDLITLLSISGPGCSVNLVTPQTTVRIDWRYSVFQSLSSLCRKILSVL